MEKVIAEHLNKDVRIDYLLLYDYFTFIIIEDSSEKILYHKSIHYKSTKRNEVFRDKKMNIKIIYGEIIVLSYSYNGKTFTIDWMNNMIIFYSNGKISITFNRKGQLETVELHELGLIITFDSLNKIDEFYRYPGLDKLDKLRLNDESYHNELLKEGKLIFYDQDGELVHVILSGYGKLPPIDKRFKLDIQKLKENPFNYKINSLYTIF